MLLDIVSRRESWKISNMHNVFSQGLISQMQGYAWAQRILPSDILMVNWNDDKFRWSIEFDQLGMDDVLICLKFWTLDSKFVASVGPVVSVGIAGKGLLSVFLEDMKVKQWVRIDLSPKAFSGNLNVDWMARGEIGVATMGFFSKTLTADKLTQLVGVHPMEIV